MRYVIILAVSVILAACQTGSKPANKSSTKAKATLTNLVPTNINLTEIGAYSCKDSLQAISYVRNDSMLLFLADTALKMRRKESADGQRYSAHSYLFWIKGQKALLQKPTGSLMKCDSQPKEKPWAFARLRGVDFRAQGQEPAWIIELTNDKQLKYISNYGQDTLIVSGQKLEKVNDSQPKQFQAKTGEHKLSLDIRSSQCTDTMSGANFPYSVSLTVDKKEYEGCGKYLTN